MSFFLFRYFKVSFNNALYFSMYKSYTPFVNFIPNYIILIDAIINGIPF